MVIDVITSNSNNTHILQTEYPICTEEAHESANEFNQTGFVFHLTDFVIEDRTLFRKLRFALEEHYCDSGYEYSCNYYVIYEAGYNNGFGIPVNARVHGTEFVDFTGIRKTAREGRHADNNMLNNGKENHKECDEFYL